MFRAIRYARYAIGISLITVGVLIAARQPLVAIVVGLSLVVMGVLITGGLL